jgi:hypothetical protein
MYRSHIHPSQRLAVLALITALLLLAGGGANAGPISWGKVESPNMYAQMATHMLLVGPADTHFIGAPPANCWASPTWLMGVVGPPDTITASHQARHLVAVCPGEAAPAPWWQPGPISPAPIPWGLSFAGLRGGVVHPGPPNHVDHFLEVLGAAYRFNMLAGYAYISVGYHDPVCEERGAHLTQDQVVPPPPPPPPDTPLPYGVAGLAVDMERHTFALSIAVQGIPQQDLVAAIIHVGAPGENGPPVYDLGGGSAWQDLEGLGLGRVTVEEPFPMEYAEAFVTGQTYICLYTTTNPGGALRGQLIAVPRAPITGDMNCDGTVNFGDINPFVMYLSSFDAWQAAFPGCAPENGDINGDGEYPSFGDINPFVALLTQ